jgi:UrcA family protein
MNTNSYISAARAAAFAAIGSMLLAGPASSERRTFAVAIPVNSTGLDLSQKSGVRQFYARIRAAAAIVCSHGDRAALAPLSDPRACRETALGDAIRSLGIPALTLVYLESHTLAEATARRIPVPTQFASK